MYVFFRIRNGANQHNQNVLQYLDWIKVLLAWQVRDSLSAQREELECVCAAEAAAVWYNHDQSLPSLQESFSAIWTTEGLDVMWLGNKTRVASERESKIVVSM